MQNKLWTGARLWTSIWSHWLIGSRNHIPGISHSFLVPSPGTQFFPKEHPRSNRHGITWSFATHWHSLRSFVRVPSIGSSSSSHNTRNVTRLREGKMVSLFGSLKDDGWGGTLSWEILESHAIILILNSNSFYWGGDTIFDNETYWRKCVPSNYHIILGPQQQRITLLGSPPQLNSQGLSNPVLTLPPCKMQPKMPLLIIWQGKTQIYTIIHTIIGYFLMRHN